MDLSISFYALLRSDRFSFLVIFRPFLRFLLLSSYSKRRTDVEAFLPSPHTSPTVATFAVASKDAVGFVVVAAFLVVVAIVFVLVLAVAAVPGVDAAVFLTAPGVVVGYSEEGLSSSAPSLPPAS